MVSGTGDDTESLSRGQLTVYCAAIPPSFCSVYLDPVFREQDTKDPIPWLSVRQ